MITGLEVAGGVAGIVLATANIRRAIDGYKARKAEKRKREARFWREQERLRLAEHAASVGSGIGMIALCLLLLL